MAKAKGSAAQAVKQKRAIKKLRDLGIIKKADLRRAPTQAVKRALKKYADVISGKAAVVKPKNPKSYGKIYRTVGDKVIVPRRKGERIGVNKSGEIVGTRKVGKRTVRSRFKAVPSGQGEKIKRPKRRVQYAIPFLRSGGEVHWMRFPDYDELKKFMEGYNYKDWPDYVVEESLNAADDEEADEKLEAKLERKRAQLAKRKEKEWARELKSLKASNPFSANTPTRQNSPKSAGGRKKKTR